MTTHDLSLHSQRSGFLGWLRLSRGDTSTAQSGTRAAASMDAVAMARMALVESIGRFLVAQNLEVSSFTLSVAHDYLAGEHPRLVRLIDSRIQAREPITIAWLEDILHNGRPDDGRVAMSSMMARMQTDLDEFGRTTTAAKSAASDYSSALEVQVDEIHRTDVTGAVIADLANLAQSMLDRTRELEKEMSLSDQQTRALQRSLAQARLTAERDHLTGLPNRRAFETRLSSEFAAAQANQEQLCIAFCDIDNFKAINDTHGHEAGDRILKTVAQNLARMSSAKCHVARHGGEEFVVLFRGITVGECWELLEEARVQQAERRLVNRATNVPFGKVTFSAGLTDIFTFPDPRAALRAADRALYRAKEEGRNRVLIGQHAPAGEFERAQQARPGRNS